MRHRFLFAAAFAALAGCERQQDASRDMSPEEVAAELARVKIAPGQWEATTEILSVKGPLPEEMMKQMRGQKTSVANCITPEQAARPSANFLAAQQDSECTYRDFSMRNGRLTGSMTCTGGQFPGEMQTQMSGEYGPESYNMKMDKETSGIPGGGTLEITARTTGKRVGECP